MRKNYFLALMMAAGTSAAFAQIADLEAHISFDGNVTAFTAGAVLQNASGGTNHGAVLTTDRNGNANSAVNLNGSSHIDFGDLTNFRFGMDDFTVALWMKGDATQAGQGIPLGKRGFIGGQDYAYMVGWTASNQQAMAYYRDDNGSAGNWPTVSVSSGQWQHLAMVFDRGAGMMYVYVNGTQISFADISDLVGFDATGTSAGQLMVGRSSQGGQFFKGDVDEVYLIRRALGQTELTDLMNGVLSPCIVNIPDANLKAALVGNASINTNGDGEIQCSEAAAYTGMLVLQNLGIADITGIEAFTSAWYISLAGNSFSVADLSANTSATQIILSNNSISSVQLPTSVVEYSCANCGLTSIDVSYLPNLSILGFVQNNVTSVNLSNNPQLTELWCRDNQLTALNVSGNPLLTHLSAFGNQIGSLDVSGNPLLHYLEIQDNNLSSLNIANGNNQNFTFYNFFGNPSLTCIQVDDAAWSTANMSAPPGAVFSNDCSALPCVVNIPDAIFKAALVGNPAINTNGDGEIQCSEAASFNGQMNVWGIELSDLTGLEAFTALTGLNIGNTFVPSFDISANTALTYLDCSGNDFGGSLSFSAANAGLQELWVNFNQLTSLDVSALTQLQVLICEYNSLSSIDVSNNPNLRELQCRDNSITSLDFSNNPDLWALGCRNNLITAIDVSDKPDFYFIDCNANNLTYLNVANGNNTNVTYFNSQNNWNLGCIQVDDVAYSTTNWTMVSSWSNFNTFCTPPTPVGIGEAESGTLTAYPNPTSDILHLTQSASGQVLDLSGRSLTAFSNARTIDLSGLASGSYLVRTVDGNVMRVVRE
jgi:hypothetical protein